MIDFAYQRREAANRVACSHPEDGLHVWQINLDDPHAHADDCAQVLDADERARAERFAFPLLRRRYLAAHAALRGVLGVKVDDGAEVMDADERARAERFAFPLLRRRYLAAHAALRGILGCSLG